MCFDIITAIKRFKNNSLTHMDIFTSSTSYNSDIKKVLT